MSDIFSYIFVSFSKRKQNPQVIFFRYNRDTMYVSFRIDGEALKMEWSTRSLLSIKILVLILLHEGGAGAGAEVTLGSLIAADKL